LNFKHTVTVLLILGGFFAPRALVAQEIAATPLGEPQEVSDAFLESFYEALKQKSIENYALAITALERAQKKVVETSRQMLLCFLSLPKTR